jgi:Flp pilus assembly pilin Flp
MPEYPMIRRQRSGQGLVEYGLILGLIAVLIVTIFVAFEGIVDIGGESSGTLSDEGIGRAGASISAGLY